MVIIRSLERFQYDRLGFLRARGLRTLPAFLAVFAIAVPVQPLPTALPWMPWVASDDPGRVIWSTGWPQHWAAELTAHLTLTHGLFPGGILPGAWISFLGAAWSLSTEWQFYAVVAVTAPMLRGRGLRALTVLFLGLAGLAILWQAAGPADWQFSRAFLPNKAAYFALGIASAPLTAPTARRCVCYLATLGATLMLCAAQAGPGKLAAPLIWSICLAAQCAPHFPGLRTLHRFLRIGPLLILGAWSYAIYLVNEPVQKLLALALAQMAAGNATVFTCMWLPCAILLPLGAARAVHHWIEQPALRGRCSSAAAVPVIAG